VTVESVEDRVDSSAKAPGHPALTPAEPIPATLPVSLPTHPWLYRVKNRLLGRPLDTEQLIHERLGKPTALAVFASDNLSSSAYATEEILRVLLPAVGVAAFAMVVPLTGAMLVVLAFLILSYRETIKAYPSAGSAYLVTKDNFGQIPALVAGTCLLIDYVLTVAVSVAAGTAALASAFHVLAPWTLPIAISFVMFIAFMNLRGIRESGRIFAVPTYCFIAVMFLLIGTGLVKMFLGELPIESLSQEGLIDQGSAGTGILYGAGLFVVLHAFASGGAAVTGVEAISDGVPAFRPPEWRNARQTLVLMGSILAVMFLGLSVLAAHMHVAPFEDGTPTVISQIGKLVFGETPLGHVLFYVLQAATTLVLVLAANTSFADFPRLASFTAADSFLPRQLTKRGHRLVFSNGILILSVASIALLIVTNAQVDRLIPMYAIGVFTSFTLSQSSMARRHLRLKEPGWQRGLLVNGFGAVLSGIVDVIFAVTKFSHGAWVVIAAVPIIVLSLLRLERQYQTEAVELEEDVPLAATARILDRHVVLVLIDQLDLSAARAIQYARTLMPDELRAVHFVLDPLRAEELADQWRRLGLTRIPLELRQCSDRLLDRAAIALTAEALADGRTEVSVLLPDRRYPGWWHRILHDRTAESIAEQVSRLPHANVTRVPYHLGSKPRLQAPPAPATAGSAAPDPSSSWTHPEPDESQTSESFAPREGCDSIGTIRWRDRVRIYGTVSSTRIQPKGGVPTLECVVSDGTGSISIVFLGRREVPGISTGTRLVAHGMAGSHFGRLAILNPEYELVSEDEISRP
jgi:amino acid transporter